MSRRARCAAVRLNGVRVGSLRESDEGFEFRYDAAWVEREAAEPISFTLPVREEPYRSRTLHPFFENLLPEGWLLEISTAKLKISRDDVFGILLATCADCFGAVEILGDGSDS